MGILRDWMVDTVAGVFEEGDTTFTIKALEQYALQPDQRVRKVLCSPFETMKSTIMCKK